MPDKYHIASLEIEARQAAAVDAQIRKERRLADAAAAQAGRPCEGMVECMTYCSSRGYKPGVPLASCGVCGHPWQKHPQYLAVKYDSGPSGKELSDENERLRVDRAEAHESFMEDRGNH
jgi:hypothetical protein